MCGPGDMILEELEALKENKMINGIKPKLQTTTKLGIKPTSFDEAMNQFCEKLTENVKPEVDRFNHMHSVTFGVGGGRKYISVEQIQKNWQTD